MRFLAWRSRDDLVEADDDNNAGYMQALRMASQQPSLIVVNVRNGRLTRTLCRLPHIESNEPLDANVQRLAITLEEAMRDW